MPKSKHGVESVRYLQTVCIEKKTAKYMNAAAQTAVRKRRPTVKSPAPPHTNTHMGRSIRHAPRQKKASSVRVMQITAYAQYDMRRSERLTASAPRISESAKTQTKTAEKEKKKPVFAADDRRDLSENDAFSAAAVNTAPQTKSAVRRLQAVTEESRSPVFTACIRRVRCITRCNRVFR